MMNFAEPDITIRIIDGIERYMKDTGLERIRDITGIL
jgi:dihydroorotate dehydrogenase